MNNENWIIAQGIYGNEELFLLNKSQINEGMTIDENDEAIFLNITDEQFEEWLKVKDTVSLRNYCDANKIKWEHASNYDGKSIESVEEKGWKNYYSLEADVLEDLENIDLTYDIDKYLLWYKYNTNKTKIFIEIIDKNPEVECIKQISDSADNRLTTWLYKINGEYKIVEEDYFDTSHPFKNISDLDKAMKDKLIDRGLIKMEKNKYMSKERYLKLINFIYDQRNCFSIGDEINRDVFFVEDENDFINKVFDNVYFIDSLIESCLGDLEVEDYNGDEKEFIKDKILNNDEVCLKVFKEYCEFTGKGWYSADEWGNGDFCNKVDDTIEGLKYRRKDELNSDTVEYDEKGNEVLVDPFKKSQWVIFNTENFTQIDKISNLKEKNINTDKFNKVLYISDFCDANNTEYDVWWNGEEFLITKCDILIDIDSIPMKFKGEII